MKIYSEMIHRLHDTCVSLRRLTHIKGHPVKNTERYNPFFIVGSGRSGNTLLRKLLNNHSTITIPPETYVLGAVIKRYRQQRTMRWTDLVDYIFSTFEFYPEFETFNISLRPLVKELKNISIENRNLAFMLNRFYHYYAQQIGSDCGRWGDKTPINTFVLERIYSVFPDAKFIHIIRDGCDVIASYMQAGIYQTFEDAAERWKVSVKLAERFSKQHPGTVLTIRYEDLVTVPNHTLLKVCNFLGLNFELQMLEEKFNSCSQLGDVEMRAHHANVLNPLNTNRIGKGRASLPVDEKKKIQNIIGDQLKSLGYDNCTF